MNTIIGIHIGHDTSTTLLINGTPVICLAEERLIREKMYYGFPFLSLAYVLDKYKLEPSDIDILAIDTNERPGLIGATELKRRFNLSRSPSIKNFYLDKLKKTEATLSYLFKGVGQGDWESRQSKAKQVLFKGLAELGFKKEQVRIYDHHLSHAASAFWCSPFSEAMVVTMDGRGDSLSATLGFGKGSNIENKVSIPDINSIGQFYSAITHHLGYRPNRHEGKITGLAAHGDPHVIGDKFLDLVQWKDDGSFSFRVPERFRLSLDEVLSDYTKLNISLKERISLSKQRNTSDLEYTLNWHSISLYIREVAADVSKEDLSAAVQYLTEEVAVDFVTRNLTKDDTNVTLAGGVFANVRVNQRILECDGVSNVFVQPAMGDVGLSLGAAILAYVDEIKSLGEVLNEDRPMVLSNVYLGPSYSDHEITDSCKNNNVEAIECSNMPAAVGRMLHDGVIVGLFHGRMEFGPRALGHRSIIARPTDRAINQDLNNRLHRTEFMPFAPSMLSEYSKEYLAGYNPDQVASEYMTITYDVNPEVQDSIQAVVHIDGTARPQIVYSDTNQYYHSIISEYHNISGIPVVVNTSFNAHEEPIVCTPDDAINSLLNNCIDVLVMEKFAVINPAASDKVKAVALAALRSNHQFEAGHSGKAI